MRWDLEREGSTVGEIRVPGGVSVMAEGGVVDGASGRGRVGSRRWEQQMCSQIRAPGGHSWRQAHRGTGAMAPTVG